ncbi:probable serine/threonine-protein kinase PBL21 [Ananas comosus]|uniref:non-specific serine/threonine protein kinase n=1 Tax=Ananas comosus TaxID=4615 RepID=A0A6P5EW40_ANACO|nr:probable serine/threonine-protein kinase PBL21 [Ananas comosus]XP_020085360.1 probable serine/threonine-protein kinase PBL21 [Ananas comosus]
MGCFPCISARRREKNNRIEDSAGARSNSRFLVDSSENGRKEPLISGERNGCARSFTFKDLAIATQNFKEANLIGAGGFGRVFKGRIDSGKVVAIKQLNREGLQGSKEFLVEILMLIMLQHPNLVSLIGYCAEGDERLLVYEYMPKGSLEDQLFDLTPAKEPLDWNTRMKIAVGAAKGLTYLHDVANPPVIYRDMKAANILLDDEFNPKLSDFGLAKVAPVGDRTHVSTRVMGTYGYCAPDYVLSGKLTLKSDIYSFGVLLLELITGRRIYDASKVGAEQNLLTWSRPFLNDRRRFSQLADPTLQGRYPPRAFHQLVVITSMCLQEQPHVRPIIGDVVVALNHVQSQPYILEPTSNTTSSPSRAPSPRSAETPSRRRRGRRGSPFD